MIGGSEHPAREQMSARDWVPWDRPGELALWFVALVLATLFIHNFVRIGKDKMLP